MENFFVRVLFAKENNVKICYESDRDDASDEILDDFSNDVISKDDELSYLSTEAIEQNFNDFIQMPGTARVNLTFIMSEIMELEADERIRLMMIESRIDGTRGALLYLTSYSICCVVLAIVSKDSALYLALVAIFIVISRLLIGYISDRRERAVRVRDRIRAYKYAISLIDAYRKLSYSALLSKLSNENLPKMRPY